MPSVIQNIGNKETEEKNEENMRQKYNKKSLWALWILYNMGCTMQKRVFRHMLTAILDQVQPVQLCIQGLHCPQTESLDIKEYFNGEKMPR